MAPFNKRQIGYIKAVAGVGQHRSYQTYSNAHLKSVGGVAVSGVPATLVNTTKNAAGEFSNAVLLTAMPQNQLTQLAALDNFALTNETGQGAVGAVYTKYLSAYIACLNNIPTTVDHNDSSEDFNNHVLQQAKFHKTAAPINKMMLLHQGLTDEGVETNGFQPNYRSGSDFYVESTHIRWRFTMPDFAKAAADGNKQPHHEFRFIVFRQRKPTFQREGNTSDSSARQALNWNYDLFNGYEGRPVCWSGHRQREAIDGQELYQNGPITNRLCNVDVTRRLNADDFMTLPINDADYVVMRDERFFLGAEHGKSHYETVTRFNWSDPGTSNTNQMDVGMDDKKNYDWWFLVLGTSNDAVPPNLNVQVRGTTAITSA